jgi:hypothetical protein
LRKEAIIMGDRSYMQITISDGPTERRRVGKLPSEYLGCAAFNVAAGETCTVEEISSGSLAELAGRFDAERTGADHVVLGHRQVFAVTEAASGHGYLARNTVPRLHALEMRPRQATAWEERPGPAEMTEAAPGIPRLLDPRAAAALRAKHRAWEKVIDRGRGEAAGARRELLASGHGRSTG